MKNSGGSSSRVAIIKRETTGLPYGLVRNNCDSVGANCVRPQKIKTRGNPSPTFKMRLLYSLTASFKASHHGRGGTVYRDGEGGYPAYSFAIHPLFHGEKFGLFFRPAQLNMPFPYSSKRSKNAKNSLLRA